MPTHRLLFLIFLLSAQVLAAQQPLTLNNTSKRLKILLESKNRNDSVEMMVAVKNADIFLKNYKATIKASYRPSQTFVVSMTKEAARQLLTDTNLLFADVKRKPKEELTTGSMDNTVNKINYMHHLFPQFTGDGINASVKEQQFDSTDIDFKGRYFNSGVAAATSSTHASIIATMLGGGGNSTISATGAAPGVQLTGSSFASLLPDADVIYRQFGISVQNHSYGTDIENFYGADAMAYDKSVLNNPTLMHVFSSGNKGTTAPADGIYAGIEGMANLTGSFKMAKNIITVGAVDSFSNIVSLSSKGPAYDGRVKPEIVAYGFDGSSGAAALISGTAAVLQQAFRTKENKLPTAALIKAVLINSADDKGTPQADYHYGFGNLNAYKALNTILQQRYWQDSLAKREIRRFAITVPEGIQQLKVTVAWTDEAAPANAAKALVNDLHATLSYNGQSWQPWILNHTADKAALLQPAIRGIDTLNNVEQITIENPQAGDYELIIDGSNIQTEKQTFSIAYQLDTAQTFSFTFPTASNAFTTGSSQIIKWQTTISDDAVLEYATSGGSWQAIQSITNIQKGWETLSVPVVTCKMVLRMRLPLQNREFYSDTIIVAPEMKMEVGFNCADSFMLYWNNAAANGYQLYALGEKYMEPIDVVADTFAVFNKAVQPSLYFAVAPRINGQTGYRS